MWHQMSITTCPQKAHVLGEDLPIRMDEPKMANTQSKKELLMTNENGIYSFNCRSSDDCFWEKKSFKVNISRTEHVMMEVPAPLVENC